jgi:hypothetical protein
MPGVEEVFFGDAERSDAEVPPSTRSVFAVTKTDRSEARNHSCELGIFLG